jgi:hypothetical protein
MLTSQQIKSVVEITVRNLKRASHVNFNFFEAILSVVLHESDCRHLDLSCTSSQILSQFTQLFNTLYLNY